MIHDEAERRAFTPEFKADAVRLVKAGDRSIAQVAKELDLTETALREWVKPMASRGATGATREAGHGKRAEAPLHNGRERR